MSVLESLRGGLIVSCQAPDDSPFSGPIFMAAMAKAAAGAGAVGIRVNGPQDIAAARNAVSVPIIGIFKRRDKDDAVYITPTLEEVRAVCSAGADIVAVDATFRERRYGTQSSELIKGIRHEFPNHAVMADVSTYEEGVAAVSAGATIVATTLSGYTEYSPNVDEPDLELVERFAKAHLPWIIAEGRISTPDHVHQAFLRGASAVVVGTAITNPIAIARKFVAATPRARVGNFARQELHRSNAWRHPSCEAEGWNALAFGRDPDLIEGPDQGYRWHMNGLHLKDLVFGVDGGQSSTRGLLVNRNGEVLGTARAGPSNHIHEPGGLERQFRALNEVFLQAFANAGIEPREVASACLGLTGSGHEPTARKAVQTRRMLITGDVQTALAGAFPDHVGVVVIAGTGSNAYGRDMHGAECRSGGWGYLAGDEGSGYDIALRALRAVFQAEDGRSASTCLSQELVKFFACRDVRDLHRQLYAGEWGRDRIASAAACVAATARNGDAVSRSILDRVASDLATLVTSCLDGLNFSGGEAPIAPIGGVFNSGDLLQEPMLRYVQMRYPNARLKQARLQPVQGAAVIALQALGVSVDEGVLSKLDQLVRFESSSEQGTEGNHK